MSMSAIRRASVPLTVLAVVAGVSGCQGGEPKAGDAPRTDSRSDVAQVLTAAYEKTAGAKSAKVRTTMSMPAGIEGGGDVEVSGVMGWDPTVMDLTVTGGMLADAGAPERMRMVWLDDVMYMDVGAKAAAEMDGKRWMKMDLAAMAEASGDKALQKQMTGGLENMNQDPAEQLAILLESPNLKHVGAEKTDGVETQHYKGSLTVAEVMDSNKSLDVLGDEERKDLLDTIEKSGVEGYDIEVWVNEDGYPARMDIAMENPQGTVEVVTRYSDYGAKASVEAPPADRTVDLMEMFTEMGEGADEAGDTQPESAAS
ncbi:hypothetical protein AB0K02_07460 [Streptomyces sp. NPDC049597]|uniref:hypothetical protein n=1 Tax=Streptomyces sp. NPDC049597 TaxID=3155276 RepID=UPI0034323469